MKRKQHILVTGAHRSGSTWTGHILSQAKEVRYVHEPFNIDINKNSPFKHWYEYLSESATKEQQNTALEYLHQHAKISTRDRAKFLYKSRSFYDLNNYFKKYLFNRYPTVLTKDPLALMSAPWFHQQFNSKVVITVRHPAAFIASLKVKDWQFDFKNWNNQPQLIHDYLSPYAIQIKAQIEKPKNIVDQGILLWNAIYGTVKEFKIQHPDWIIVKHEDLSLNPIMEFSQLFSDLGLIYNKQIQKKIVASTSGGNNKLQRNAKDNIKTWQLRLDDDEVYRIHDGCKAVSSYFYDDSFWQ